MPLVDYRGNFFDAISTDDRLWHQAMVVHKCLHEEQPLFGLDPNQMILWKLLNMGTSDMPSTAKPWDASTRSMRHASAIGDRLWVELRKERIRVSIQFLSLNKRN